MVLYLIVMDFDHKNDLFGLDRIFDKDPYRDSPYKMMLGSPRIDQDSIYYASWALTYSAKNLSSDLEHPLYQTDFYNRLWCLCYLIYHRKVLNKWTTFIGSNKIEDEMISSVVTAAYLRFIKVDKNQDVLFWTRYLIRASLSTFWWWFNNVYSKSPSLIAQDFLGEDLDDEATPVVGQMDLPDQCYELVDMAREFYRSLMSLEIHPNEKVNNDLVHYTFECSKSFDFDSVIPPSHCDSSHLIMSRIHAESFSRRYRDVLTYV